jgi:hypothetical protein
MIESALLEEGVYPRRRSEKNSSALEQMVSMSFRGVTMGALPKCITIMPLSV